jgi:response regulator of citrate/malate metabolism
MSALGDEKAERVGITTYLIKPVSPQMVKDTIEKYMRGSVRQMQ